MSVITFNSPEFNELCDMLGLPKHLTHLKFCVNVDEAMCLETRQLVVGEQFEVVRRWALQNRVGLDELSREVEQDAPETGSSIQGE